MGLFGGSSQSTQSLVSSIDFSPIIQFGENLESSYDKKVSQKAETSPKLDDSTGLSAVVPIYSTAGSNSATTSRRQQENNQRQESQPREMATLGGYAPQYDKMLLYGGGALVVIGGVYYFSKKKGK